MSTEQNRLFLTNSSQSDFQQCFRWLRSAVLIAFVLLFFGVLSGCGGGQTEPGAPIIRDFQFTGQDSNNPRIFYFTIAWQDNEGDIATKTESGKLVFEILDLETQKKIEISYPLPWSSFQAPLKNGTFEKVGIEFSTAERYPRRMKVSLFMWDSQKHISNNPYVVLESNQ